MERCLDILKNQQLDTWEKREEFFLDPEIRPYLLLNYLQFKEIFQQSNFQLPRINKMLIYTELEFYNHTQNESWKYRWYPILFKFAYNSIRFKPTSFFLTLGYLVTYQFFFEKLTVFQYIDKKLIDVGAILYQQYSRQHYIDIQDKQFEKFKQVIIKELEAQNVDLSIRPSETIICGNKFNVYNPYLSWHKADSEEQEQERLKFFYQNNQIPQLIQQLKSLGIWMYEASVEKKRQDLQVLRQEIKNELYRFYYEFSYYKKLLKIIPTRQKIKNLLDYDAIDKRKLFTLQDEVKYQISKVLTGFNYIFYGDTDFVRHDFLIFESNIMGKRPQYKIEDYKYELMTFTSLCILPTKLFKIGPLVEQSLKLFNYAKKNYKN
ncbi:hypothetical protein pb186bvf_007479 [Paramecium bursaria]